MSSSERNRLHPHTRLAHDKNLAHGIVATPVYHASTVLFESYEEFKRISADPGDRKELYYGRMGTPTTRSLEDALAELDNSLGALLTSSGLAAVAEVLQCLLRPGDHLLMVDSCYGPTRSLCKQILNPGNIEVSFYDPLIGADIASLIRDNTRMIFMESPGSATFEIQDVPAITSVALDRGVITAIDNTWATPLLFNPLDFGVDIAIQAGTKYLNGHADVMLGVISTRSKELLRALSAYKRANGSHLAPDDAAMAQRGMRTLGVRLQQHQISAMSLAKWFQQLPRTVQVLHPAFESCPGHEVFKRDFTGASGLFAVVLENLDESQLSRLINNLQLFGIGYSWGGFESLVLPMQVQRSCENRVLQPGQTLLRFHAGLEHPDDLLADLEQAFGGL